MSKNKHLVLIILALLLVASLVLAACDLTETPPPGHICRHLCSEPTCQKCTDKTCTDPECADKCPGHGTTSSGDDDTCGHADCDCDDCTGNDCTCDNNSGANNPPAAPQITAPFNGSIYHQGTTTFGEMTLLENGNGMVQIHNPNASFADNFVDCSITYTLSANGEFKIWTASDSNIKTPVVGKVEGRTVSITLQNELLGNTTSYEFKSTLNKVTVTNMYGDNETNVFYYPEGYAADMSATLDGYTLDYALVNNVPKTNSQMASFTVPGGDVTIQYYWTLVVVEGDYTIVYKPGEGTGTDYTDYTNRSVYTVLSLYAMTSPSNDVEGEDPEYFMNFTAPAGKFFMGWLIEGSSTIVKNGATITLTDDTTTLVAQWGSNFTVTLTGLGGGTITGVESNLTNIGWAGSYAEGFTQEFSPSSNFALPAETAQWSSVAHVSRSGFILLGWYCSEHDEIHAPGSPHVLTQDVTFEAKWQRDDGTSPLDGTYTATTAFDLTDWGQGVYVRAELSGRTLTLYTVSNETYVVEDLTISGNTATGSTTFFSFTLTLDGDTLTISVKRGGLAAVHTGTFTKTN